MGITVEIHRMVLLLMFPDIIELEMLVVGWKFIIRTFWFVITSLVLFRFEGSFKYRKKWLNKISWYFCWIPCLASLTYLCKSLSVLKSNPRRLQGKPKFSSCGKPFGFWQEKNKEEASYPSFVTNLLAYVDLLLCCCLVTRAIYHS